MYQYSRPPPSTRCIPVTSKALRTCRFRLRSQIRTTAYSWRIGMSLPGLCEVDQYCRWVRITRESAFSLPEECFWSYGRLRTVFQLLVTGLLDLLKHGVTYVRPVTETMSSNPSPGSTDFDKDRGLSWAVEIRGLMLIEDHELPEGSPVLLGAWSLRPKDC